MQTSPLLTQLMEALRCLPGVGPKSAQRMAFTLLQRDRSGGMRLAQALTRAMSEIGHCADCRTFTEQEVCNICSNPRRQENGQICVVESPADIYAIEQTGQFSGRYFVLMGHLSPLDGIGPDDIGLDRLEQRLAEEKLVVNTPNKGMSVRTLTPHELNETFDIRLMMDTFFIKDIITTLNYNNTLRQQLLENMEKQKQFIACNDSTMDAEGYFQLDLEFHMLYLTASGNQKAVEVLKDLQPFTFSAGTYFNQPHYRDCECVEEHQAILDAALAADPEGLRKAIETHISNSRRAFQLIFKVNQMV